MTRDVSKIYCSWQGGLVVGGRSPKLFTYETSVLGEESIKIYLTYLDQLKKLFTNFIHTNLNEKRKVCQFFNESDLSGLGLKMEGNWREKALDGSQRIPQNVQDEAPDSKLTKRWKS